MSKTKITLSIPLTRGRIAQMADEADRRAGRLRALVLRQIRAERDPAPADVAAALREPAPTAKDGYPVPRRVNVTDIAFKPVAALSTPDQRPAAIAQRQAAIDADTRELHDYIARTFLEGRPRRRGRKTRSRTTRQELAIAAAYFGARAAADSAKTVTRRPTDEEIKGTIAEQHGISVRTLERIIGEIKPPARRQN